MLVVPPEEPHSGMRLTVLPCAGLISLTGETPFCSSDEGSGIKLQVCGLIHAVYKMVSKSSVIQLRSYATFYVPLL